MPPAKSLPRRIYRHVANLIDPALPSGLRAPAHYWSRRLTRRLEPEFDYAMSLAKPGSVVVDIGANIGIYTYGFLKRGAIVHAVEPQPACAASVRALEASILPLGRARGRILTVHETAIGPSFGEMELQIPLRNGRTDTESASLVRSAGEHLIVRVPIRPIDSFGWRNISFVKVDVEGYEVPVIASAAETIRRERPALLVEIEQRHHQEPILDVFRSVFDVLGPGYEGWYLGADGSRRPLASFDIERDQLLGLTNVTAPTYVNNFFFLPCGALPADHLVG